MTAKAQFPHEQNEHGEFKRQQDSFHGWVTADGRSGYPAEPGRYHLYVSWACPWAHRTIIVRKLKQLEDVIGMTAVDPLRDERGWAFRDGPQHSTDLVNGFKFLSEAYFATDQNYRGRVTVPVLWDTKMQRIVSNSDDDIMRMLNREFDRLTESRIDLPGRPPEQDRRTEYVHLRERQRWSLPCGIRDLAERLRTRGPSSL